MNLKGMNLDFGAQESFYKILSQWPDMYNRKRLHFATPQLAVGSIKVSDNCLQDNGITHVISACGVDSHLSHRLFTLFSNPMHDDGEDQPREYWQRTIDFALPVLEDPANKLFVHCMQGVNRGPAHAYAILRAQGYEDIEAWDLIKQARFVAEPRYVDNIDNVVFGRGI